MSANAKAAGGRIHHVPRVNSRPLVLTLWRTQSEKKCLFGLLVGDTAIMMPVATTVTAPLMSMDTTTAAGANTVAIVMRGSIGSPATVSQRTAAVMPRSIATMAQWRAQQLWASAHHSLSPRNHPHGPSSSDGIHLQPLASPTQLWTEHLGFGGGQVAEAGRLTEESPTQGGTLVTREPLNQSPACGNCPPRVRAMPGASGQVPTRKW